MGYQESLSLHAKKRTLTYEIEDSLCFFFKLTTAAKVKRYIFTMKLSCQTDAIETLMSSNELATAKQFFVLENVYVLEPI